MKESIADNITTTSEKVISRIQISQIVHCTVHVTKVSSHAHIQYVADMNIRGKGHIVTSH